MKDELTFLKSVHRLRDLPRDGLPEICISGRSNVGKSSMINRLAIRRNLAKISKKPGKTRSLNYYATGGAYYIVDLPGYGYAKVSREQRKFFADLTGPYLNERSELRGIIQLLDSRHGPVSGDLAMLEWLQEWGGNVLYVLTKADKLSANGRVRALSAFAEEYGDKDVVLFSAVTGMGLDDLRRWIRRIIDT